MHTTTNARICRGWLMAALVLLGLGCHSTKQHTVALPPPGTVPNEMNMITLPPYVIAPPDELLIEVVAAPTEAGKPPTLLTPQPISGRHPVRPDGTVGLGVYGMVQMAGLTLDQAKESIRTFLAPRVNIKPEALLVVVDVIGFNSKQYFVITDGGGLGEGVFPFPCTGNETVLSALANINGIPQEGSKRNIWVARRSPHGGPDQILPVDWVGITQHGITETNWQVLPGDRVYVKADKFVKADRTLSKVLAPFERIFGVTLLGANTYNQVSGRGLQNNLNR
ncbi:polysaccharide biosynthesis/export family protein [Tuwongella immobilis]|nr:polysaccharide biosynthesis/export family protein [Tuwongella immobilis]